ncbi:MAG TPA: TatD family deoxyribonuclease [bacterium]|nr:TatD family deoxyribonuclease [bacterium]
MFNPLSHKGIIDTHCHLNSPQFDKDRDDVVQRAVDAGVEKIIDIAVDIETSKKALENSEKYPGVVYPSAGVDMEVLVPGSDLFDEKLFAKSQLEIGKWVNEQMRKLDGLLETGKFVMIGECGLDHYWLRQNEGMKNEEKEKSKLMQKLLFASQVELAIKYNLLLSIHSRGAEKECIEIIRRFKEQGSSPIAHSSALSGSFHSFTGTVEQAKQIVKLGFKIGVNGIVTYKSADNVREVVKAAGLENIVFETDAPYLVPSGFKPGGLNQRRNEPGSVVKTIEYVKDLLQK